MQQVIDISLAGHADPYRVHEDAYHALGRYLAQARAGLTGDPDQDEVLGDLERSIGDKLDARLGLDTRIVGLADVEAVLEEVGPVAGGDASVGGAPAPVWGAAPGGDAAPGGGPAPRPDGRGWRPPVRRRLYRIREGQNLAGVSTGLAAYADVDVTWVRVLFVLLTIFTAGLGLVVYVVMAIVLPVASTYDEWIAVQEAGGRP